MSEVSKLNVLETIDMEEGHATALVDVDLELIYRKKQEQYAALEDELRRMGIDGLRFPSALDFWTDRALMSNFLKLAQEAH